MRKYFCLLSAVLLVSLALPAAYADNVPTFFETGVSASGAWLPAGAEDPHWTVMGLTSSGAEIGPYPTYVASPGPQGWYSQIWTGTEDTDTWDNIVYTTSFDLTGYDPSSAELSFSFYSYNYCGGALDGIYLNGIDYYPQCNTNGHLPTFTSGFLPGINTLTFVFSTEHPDDAFSLYNVSATANPSVPSSVPEPATLMLLGSGLLGLWGVRRKPLH